MIRGKEIIGIRELTLFNNKDVRFERPNIGIEDEVNLYSTNNGNYIISEVLSQIRWERTLSNSTNYKINYMDELSFFVHGIENEIPEIIYKLRSNRNGYIADIRTIDNDSYVFQSPFFLFEKNIKRVNSHSWQVTLSYRIPTFEDRLIRLDLFSYYAPIDVRSNIEIQGIRRLALYINSDVRINRPDASKENEVDIIAHGKGSFVIDEVIEVAKWEREINYSENYKPNFIDTFTFSLHGLKNNVPFILKSMRNNRLGYIVEIITTGNKSYVFQAPVFLNEDNTKPINSHSWQVSLSYRVPTFEDRLIKLNTVLMTESYILVGDNAILGNGDGAIVSN